MAALPASERGADTAPGRRGAGATSGVTGGAGGPVGRWAGGPVGRWGDAVAVAAA